MARNVATNRLIATGRSVASLRSAVVNFANSLNFVNASNQYGTNAWTSQYAVPSRTLEWWQLFTIKPAGTEPMFSSSGANYYFGFAADGMILSYSDASAVQRTFTVTNLGLQTSTWYHFASTVDTSGSNVTVKHYKNGVEVGTQTLTSGHSSSYSSPFRLGLFAPTSVGPTGSIANMGFYDRALTANEVLLRSKNYPVSSGAVSRWLFSEGSGATVNDSVGSGHWTLTNTPTWSSTNVPMKAPRLVA